LTYLLLAASRERRNSEKISRPYLIPSSLPQSQIKKKKIPQKKEPSFFYPFFLAWKEKLKRGGEKKGIFRKGEGGNGYYSPCLLIRPRRKKRRTSKKNQWGGGGFPFTYHPLGGGRKREGRISLGKEKRSFCPSFFSLSRSGKRRKVRRGRKTAVNAVLDLAGKEGGGKRKRGGRSLQRGESRWFLPCHIISFMTRKGREKKTVQAPSLYRVAGEEKGKNPSADSYSHHLIRRGDGTSEGRKLVRFGYSATKEGEKKEGEVGGEGEREGRLRIFLQGSWKRRKKGLLYPPPLTAWEFLLFLYIQRRKGGRERRRSGF